MKKSDLIKYLQELPGNPEVVLWNGYAGDWMPIVKPSYLPLVKITKDFWLRSVENEKARDGKPPELSPEEEKTLIRRWSESQWEFNEYVTDADIAQGRYKKKTVIVLDAKPRGLKSYDRIGVLEY